MWHLRCLPMCGGWYLESQPSIWVPVPPDTHKTENRDVGPLASQFSLGAWPMLGPRDGIGQSRESLLSALGSVTSSPPALRTLAPCPDVMTFLGGKITGLLQIQVSGKSHATSRPGTAADLVEHNEPLTRRAETSQGPQSCFSAVHWRTLPADKLVVRGQVSPTIRPSKLGPPPKQDDGPMG